MRVVVRRFAIALLLLAGGLPLKPATLERLSLDEMIEKSTAIVRGRVAGAWAASNGRVIYTHYRVQIVERWKGPQQGEVEFVVPGGTFNNIRQECPGAPALAAGEEYVLFLWTSKAGVTYIIGFTQGIFSLPKESGEMAVRAASNELMFEQGTGRIVRDERIEMRLPDLRSRIVQRLGSGKGARQ